MLRHLIRRNEVTLISFVRNDDRPEAVAHLRALGADVRTVLMQRSLAQNLRAAAKGLATGQPIIAARDETVAMNHMVTETVRAFHPNVVQADQLSMAGYGQSAARTPPVRPLTLLDEHNAIYLLARRIAATEPNPLRRIVAAREARAFRGYESAMCRAYDHLFTVTSEDREHLLALYPGAERDAAAAKFTVIPICVDPTQVAPAPRAPGGPPTILHLGTMFWPPNVAGVMWFAREVLPLIHRELPGARFVVLGKKPPDEVLALTQDSRIEVTGYVPDPMPYLAATDAFVVPLLAGGGMRVKILDAWLWGMPIVSTPIGAEGIAVRDGENILLAQDPAEFAAATLRVLREPALNDSLRREGRAWVETHYAWQTVYERVDDVYDNLLRDRG
jgi:glycosyltransferase involved in cell wall biosynthesis